MGLKYFLLEHFVLLKIISSSLFINASRFCRWQWLFVCLLFVYNVFVICLLFVCHLFVICCYLFVRNSVGGSSVSRWQRLFVSFYLFLKSFLFVLVNLSSFCFQFCSRFCRWIASVSRWQWLLLIGGEVK